MQGPFTLHELPVTNQCVVVCDLDALSTPQSPAWRMLAGTQDEVGAELAEYVQRLSVSRLDDFGGVCKSFLCDEEAYVEVPPRTKPGAAVFSFTPKKRLIEEAGEMARVARSSGYALLILTLQKDGKFGKVWVLCGMLRHLEQGPLTYYEDTNTVVDELKASPEAGKVVAVHVQAPGFEDHVSEHADRTVSQQQYRQEVLA